MEFKYDSVRKNDKGEVVFESDYGFSDKHYKVLEHSYTFGMHDKVMEIIETVKMFNPNNSLHKINPHTLTIKRVSPDLKVDDKVLVFDFKGEKWRKRHFHSFTSDGRIRTIDNGETSWTIGDETQISTWRYWKLPEE